MMMGSSYGSTIKQITNNNNNMAYGSTEWFSTICRICLQQEEYEMRSIFDKDAIANSLLLCEKIMECSAVKIVKGSNLPEQICKRCVVDLEIAYRFRKNCENSDAILKSFDIKTSTSIGSIDKGKVLNNERSKDNKNKDKLIIKNSNNTEIFQFKPPIGLNVKRTVVKHDKIILNKLYNNNNNNKVRNNEQNQIKSIVKNEDQFSKNIESICVYDSDSIVKDEVKMDIDIDNIKCDPIDYDNTINLVTSSDISVNHQDLDEITVLGNIELLDCVEETGDEDVDDNQDNTNNNNYNDSDNEDDIIYEYDSFQKSDVFTSPDDDHINIDKESKDQPESIKNVKLSPIENYSIENLNEAEPQQVIDENNFEISLIHPLKNIRYNRKSNKNQIMDNADDDKIKFNPLKSSITLSKSKKKPKQCDICGNFYNYQHELTSHMRRHNNIKPFGCSICGMSFVIKFELSRHMRTHTGAKPYPCRFCDRKYSDFGNRIKHERSHTGERPYECLTCHKRFAYSHVLLSHTLTHTGEKKFFCELCDKRFTKGHHLKAHLRSHANQLLRANSMAASSSNAKRLKQKEFTVEREILESVRKETAKATKELEKSIRMKKKQQQQQQNEQTKKIQRLLEHQIKNDYCYLLSQNGEFVASDSTYKNVMSIIEEAGKKKGISQINNEMNTNHFVIETVNDQNDDQQEIDNNQNTYHYDDDDDDNIEEEKHELIFPDVVVEDDGEQQQQNYEQEFIIKGENGVSYLKRGDNLIPIDNLIDENDLNINYDDSGDGINNDNNNITMEYIQQSDVGHDHTNENLNHNVNNLYVDDYGNVTIQSGIVNR